MDEANPTAERREAILGDVAEGLHAIFKETQRRTLAAEDDEAFARLSASLCDLARGIRQCVGWHARLERERRSDEAQAALNARLSRLAQVEDRKHRLARVVGRRLEAERPEDDDDDALDARLGLLSERLEDLCEDTGFLDHDPDALLARLCREFGVTAPPPRPATRIVPHPLVPANAGPQAGPHAGTVARTGSALPSRANGHDPRAEPADTS